MAPPATEIAILPLSAASTIEDPTSPAGQIWKSSLETVRAQEGCQLVYWGRQVENPNTVDFFVDWDSAEWHRKFVNSSPYKAFEDKLLSILDGKATVYDACFSPHAPSSALSRSPPPTTEYATFYFPSNISDAERNSWNLLFSHFKQTLEQNADGFKEFTERLIELRNASKARYMHHVPFQIG